MLAATGSTIDAAIRSPSSANTRSDRLDVVERHRERVARGALGHARRARDPERRHAAPGSLREQRVRVPVVAALELQDQVPPGASSGQPDRAHGRLGAARHEPDHLDRGHRGDDAFGELDLELGRARRTWSRATPPPVRHRRSRAARDRTAARPTTAPDRRSAGRRRRRGRRPRRGRRTAGFRLPRRTPAPASSPRRGSRAWPAGTAPRSGSRAGQDDSQSAASFAWYVRIRSAPARRIDVSISSTTRAFVEPAVLRGRLHHRVLAARRCTRPSGTASGPCARRITSR